MSDEENQGSLGNPSSSNSGSGDNKEVLKNSIIELADILHLYVIDKKIYPNRPSFLDKLETFMAKGKTDGIENKVKLETISGYYLMRMKERVSQINGSERGHQEIKINQKICKLRGDREEDLEDWIFQIESCLKGKKNIDAINALAPFVEFRALNVLKKFRENCDQNAYDLWEPLKTDFRKSFQKKSDQWKFREQLDEIRFQGRFDKFVVKFMAISDKVDMPESELIYKFISKMSGQAKQALILHTPESLERAIRVAASYEEAIKDERYSRESFNRNEVRKVNYARVEFPRKHRERGFQKQTPKKEYPDRKKVQCYNCRKYGHIAKDCRVKKSNVAVVCSSKTNELKLLSIEGLLDGKKIQMCFDSGATASIISNRAAQKYGIKIRLSDSKVQTVDGSINSVVGITDLLEIDISGIKCWLELLVIHHEGHEILLGLDWFKLTRVGLYPDENVLRLPGRVIKLSEGKRFEIEEEEFRWGEEIMVTEAIDSEDMITETDWDFGYDVEIKPKEVSLLSTKELNHFRGIIPDIKEVVAKDIYDLKECSVRKHVLQTNLNAPIFIPAYRKSMHEREVIKEHVKEMLDAKIIEPSSSPWSSPVLIIPKSDGSKRFCVDYRKLNSITETEHWPIPRIHDIFDSLAGSEWFTTIDLKSGYWQIAMDKESIEKTAFSTPDGHYQFKRMPFGLKNAPADFSRIMYQVLGNLNYVKIYLDDITIHSKSLDQHVKHIQEVCKRLKRANLKINIKKCEWCAKEIKLLGHIISKNNVLMDPKKISAIKDRQVPKCVKDIQIFLGICGYYRRFIKDYAEMTVPLTNLLQGGVKFECQQEQQVAFDKLKEALVSYPILKMPDFDKPFLIYTDASGYALGAVLAQKNPDGGESSVAYVSRTLKGAELNYGITEKECLAVVWAIKQFRVYVHGNKFTVITDHAALVWLMNISDPTGRLARWSIYLQAYTFDIIHRKGLLHSNADALSRPPTEGVECQAMLNYVYSINSIDPVDDEPLLQYLNNGKFKEGTSRKTTNRILKLLPNYKLEDGKLMFRKNILKDDFREVPNKALREDIILKAHLLGHFQTESTVKRIKEKYHWKNMERDVMNIISKCKECMENHGIIHKEHPARATKINYVHERIGIDLVNGFPETKEGYNGVLVITEYLTKYIMVYPISSKGAEDIAERLFEYIGVFGPPKIILSDQGTEFLNEVVDEVIKAVGAEHRITSAYHPRTNGQVERYNRVFVDTIRKYTTANNTEWHKWIPFVCLAYRSRVHSSTGFTPFELMFGRKMTTFEDWRQAEDGNEESSLVERAKEIKDLIEKDHVKAKEKVVKSQESQVKSQNKRSRIEVERLPIGTKVYVGNREIGEKLRPKYEGPFTVVEHAGEGNYILENILGEKMFDKYPLERLKVVPNEKEEEEYYTVEKIISHKGAKGKEKYFVKWKNYADKHNTWEPAENFHDKKLLRKYWESINKSSNAKKKKKININLMTVVIIMLLLPLALGENITMTDRIYLCHETQLRNQPILHKENCLEKGRYNDLNVDTEYKNTAILSKDSFEIYGRGYECHKEIIKTTTSVNFFGARSKNVERFSVRLTEDECWEMVNFNRCGPNPMTFEEEVCGFDGTPKETYGYLTTHKEEGYICKLRPRFIRTRHKENKLFGKSCTAIDHVCRMDESIIIWKDLTHICPFSLVKQVALVFKGEGILYAEKERLAFQITKDEEFCGRKMLKTTSGLYLVMDTAKNDMERLLIRDMKQNRKT